MTDDSEARDGRARALEYVCARRASLTVAFVISGMFLLVSVFLLAAVPLSPASRAIAVADVAITGLLCAVSGATLWLCNRARRGER